MHTYLREWAAAAAALAVSCGSAAQAQVTTVSVPLGVAPLQTGVSRTSYGSGFDYANIYFNMMFATDNKTYRIMTETLKPGTVRFPTGTPSLWYVWDRPEESVEYGPHGPDTYMGPEVIYDNFSLDGTPENGLEPVGSDAIFQINTYAHRVNNDWSPVLNNGVIDPAALDGVADAAKAWVESDREMPCFKQTEYWEIGNEEYARMSPENYAIIFKAIATKMLSVPEAVTSPCNKPIRLLATATALNFDYGYYNSAGFNQTDGVHWLQRFAGRLVSDGFDLTKIHAITSHIYLNGNNVPTLENRANKMFSEIAQSKEAQTLKAALASDIRNYITPRPTTARYLPNWEVWMTEYNVLENDPVGSDSINPSGVIQDLIYRPTFTAQKKAHGILLADWTAKALSMGVKRVLPHSIDHEPRMALVSYDNNGGTLQNPIMMPGGYIMSEMAQNFVGDVYQANNDSGSSSTAYGSFSKLASYATLSTTGSGKMLNVMLVNRDLAAAQTVRLRIWTKKFVEAGTVQVKTLTGELGSTNAGAANPEQPAVRWSAPVSFTAGRCSVPFETLWFSCTLANTISVPKASVVFVRVPVQ